MKYSCAASAAILVLWGVLSPTFGSPQESSTQSLRETKTAKLPPQTFPSSLGFLKSGVDYHSCDISCNGHKMHVEGSHRERGGSCWGKLKSECSITDRFIFPNMTVTYQCDGAFEFTPINRNDKVTASALTCEAAMFTMTEIFDDNCPGGTCYTGIFCLSNSAIISAKTEGYSESAIHCNEISAYGNAHKVADRGSHGQKGHWAAATDADVTQILQDSLTQGMWTEPLANVDRSMEASAIQEVEDEAADTTSAVSRASAASLLHRNPLAAVDKNGYTWTCNGAKIHRWLSWWPCWGVTKFQAKFGDDASSMAIDFECHGLSFLMWMMCKGLSTLHTNSKGPLGGKVVGTESMEVTNGKKRVVQHVGSDWLSEVTHAKGPTSVRSRLLEFETEPPEDVKATVAAIMNSATKGEFKGA